ncbi:FHA domain-containing protein [Pectinatus haikarae]|uniref:FHA domain-containing protein n=1 Tax=Pectinatus haikarae TaxID=349096 RepID=A0ABT9Y3D2_9FIRM|nr:FHA domain-containing protein [Pectinatus haikarae]MDQ0202322.1 hypothetical protein [Pectinatus haikarae]
MTIKILITALEYALLFCICAFVYKTMRAMYFDIREKAYSKNEAHAEKKVALLILQSYDERLLNKRILFSDMLTLGRGPDNDIVLSDAYVSHHHAVISPIKNQYQIEDLHSRNRTYVNETELDNKIFLQNEDIIKIGTTIFRFER